MNCNAKAVDALQNIPYNKKSLIQLIKLLSIYTNITPGWVLVGDLPLQKSEMMGNDLGRWVPGRFLYRIEWIEILFAIC